MGIDNTISERAKTHGEYGVQSQFCQGMKYHMRTGENWSALSDDKKESLEMIAVKISRILHGSPEHKDSWHDIGGYARLIEETL